MAISEENLKVFLRDNLGVDLDVIDETTALFSSGLIDSFSMVELLVFIEQQTSTKINPIDVNLDNLDSISKIISFAKRISEG